MLESLSEHLQSSPVYLKCHFRLHYMLPKGYYSYAEAYLMGPRALWATYMGRECQGHARVTLGTFTIFSNLSNMLPYMSSIRYYSYAKTYLMGPRALLPAYMGRECWGHVRATVETFTIISNMLLYMLFIGYLSETWSSSLLLLSLVRGADTGSLRASLVHVRLSEWQDNETSESKWGSP